MWCVSRGGGRGSRAGRVVTAVMHKRCAFAISALTELFAVHVVAFQPYAQLVGRDASPSALRL